MSEVTLYRGTPHPLTFAGERTETTDTGPLEQPPRAEVRGMETPINHATLELGGYQVRVPLYELSFGPIDIKSARAIGSLALDELVVVSRLAERGARLRGETRGFAHPALMERDAKGAIVQAHVAAMPIPVQSQGYAQHVFTRDVAPTARKLINCMPEEMLLRTANQHIAIPRDPNQPWLDPYYAYSYAGESTSGVTLAHSKIEEVKHIPRRLDGDTLLLSHTEAVLEAIRTGVEPEITSRMVFAVGLGRGPEGFQGNVCTGLGYYSKRTLHQYLEQVGI